MTLIKPNANFYILGGISVHDNQSSEYQEIPPQLDGVPVKIYYQRFSYAS